MDASLHVLLALGLVIPAIVIVLSELALGRRPRVFRQLHGFSFGSAFFLVPAHVVSAVAETHHVFHVALVAITWISLIMQLGLVAFGCAECGRVRDGARAAS